MISLHWAYGLAFCSAFAITTTTQNYNTWLPQLTRLGWTGFQGVHHGFLKLKLILGIRSATLGIPSPTALGLGGDGMGWSFCLPLCFMQRSFDAGSKGRLFLSFQMRGSGMGFRFSSFVDVDDVVFAHNTMWDSLGWTCTCAAEVLLGMRRFRGVEQ